MNEVRKNGNYNISRLYSCFPCHQFANGFSHRTYLLTHKCWGRNIVNPGPPVQFFERKFKNLHS